MANVNQDFEIWQGDSRTINLTVEDMTDLAGVDLYWGIADTPGRDPLVQKSHLGGITFTGNVMHIVLDPADTRDLTPKEYYHEAVVVDSSGARGVVSTGRVFIRAASLRNT